VSLQTTEESAAISYKNPKIYIEVDWIYQQKKLTTNGKWKKIDGLGD
jgi:hypothetical protein